MVVVLPRKKFVSTVLLKFANDHPRKLQYDAECQCWLVEASKVLFRVLPTAVIGSEAIYGCCSIIAEIVNRQSS